MVVEMVLGLVVVMCDALRDRWVDRRVGWWRWHIVKWLAFYTPFVYVIVTDRLPVLPVFGYAVFCCVLWRIAYRY
jgi:hypothetical protein